jgi:MYXO-CTERM domain-containing protein
MLRTLFSLLVLATAMLIALPAHAAGKVTVSQTEVSEVSGAWRVRMTIELPKAPSMPHLPMKFLFTPTAVFERSLVDGKTEPVTSTTSLSGQTPNIESLDVDFADASGKVFNRTRFDFGVTRTRGFQAGVYKLQVRTSDGVDIGGATSITLKGDNDVVDRRAISFNTKDPKIKKVDNGLDGGASGKAGTDDSVASANNGGDVTAVGTAAPFIPQDAYNRTEEEELKTRPKGCGCDVPSQQPWSASAALVLAGLGALMLRRRRTA